MHDLPSTVMRSTCIHCHQEILLNEGGLVWLTLTYDPREDRVACKSRPLPQPAAWDRHEPQGTS